MRRSSDEEEYYERNNNRPYPGPCRPRDDPSGISCRTGWKWKDATRWNRFRSAVYRVSKPGLPTGRLSEQSDPPSGRYRAAVWKECEHVKTGYDHEKNNNWSYRDQSGCYTGDPDRNAPGLRREWSITTKWDWKPVWRTDASEWSRASNATGREYERNLYPGRLPK